jgi:RHS repeat-associated protein
MTTVTNLSAARAVLDAALRGRRPVRVFYHGPCRVVCPHALSWKKERPMVLAYQTGGQITTGHLDPDPRRRWRVMYVDEIDRASTSDPTSTWGTADNYNHTKPGVRLFDPFGQPLTSLQPNSPGDLAYGFEGKHGIGTDNSGVVLMRARLYDPALGRFLQVDAVFGGSCNGRGEPEAQPDVDALHHAQDVLMALRRVHLGVEPLAELVPGELAALPEHLGAVEQHVHGTGQPVGVEQRHFAQRCGRLAAEAVGHDGP